MREFLCVVMLEFVFHIVGSFFIQVHYSCCEYLTLLIKIHKLINLVIIKKIDNVKEIYIKGLCKNPLRSSFWSAFM